MGFLPFDLFNVSKALVVFLRALLAPFMMLGKHEGRNSRLTIFTALIVRGCTKRILFMFLCWRCIGFGHRVILAAEFEVICELAPKEGALTERTGLIVHELR